MFDAEIVQGSFYTNNGAFRDTTIRIRSNESDFIYLTTGKYTINADGVDNVVYYAYSSEDTSTFLYYRSMTSWQSLPCTITVQTPCYFHFGFRFSDDSDIIPSDISNIMLNKGSTALPYEPYGESVGDRTANLFNLESITLKKSLGYDGSIYTAQSSNLSAYIQILSDNCVLSYNYTTLASSSKRNICFYNSKKQCIGYMQYLPTDLSTLISLPENCKYIRITLDENIYNVMLNSGSTALPYEPYGYRVPVTVTNGTDTQTTNIYLPEPLTKSGDNADYIDYAAQKRHNSDGTESSVTLPEISTFAGTNTLSVGTTVQPSNIYLKGKIKETL